MVGSGRQLSVGTEHQQAHRGTLATVPISRAIVHAATAHLLRLSLMAVSVSRASATLSLMSVATRLLSSSDSIRATSSAEGGMGVGRGAAATA